MSQTTVPGYFNDRNKTSTAFDENVTTFFTPARSLLSGISRVPKDTLQDESPPNQTSEPEKEKDFQDISSDGRGNSCGSAVVTDTDRKMKEKRTVDTNSAGSVEVRSGPSSPKAPSTQQSGGHSGAKLVKNELPPFENNVECELLVPEPSQQSDLGHAGSARTDDPVRTFSLQQEEETNQNNSEIDENKSSKEPLLHSTEEKRNASHEQTDGEDSKAHAREDDEDDSGLPVDRGWAWVIMTAQFILTLTMLGYGRSLSIFFLEFITMFQASVATATVGFGIMAAAFGLGNFLVSNLFLSRIEARKIVLVGAVLASAAVSVSALAPNIIFIIVTHAFIGFSHAMMYIPSVTLLSHYFRKRRSFANAVASTGISISALVFPPSTELLISSFGTRGAMLLAGGIQLQAVVAACLLRPVEFYTKRIKTNGRAHEEGKLHNSDLPDHRIKTLTENDEREQCNSTDKNRGDVAKHSEDEGLKSGHSKDIHDDDLESERSELVPASMPTYSYFSEDEHRVRSSSFSIKHSHTQSPSGNGRKNAFLRQLSHPHDTVHHEKDRAISRRSKDHLQASVSVFSSSMIDVCGSTVSIPAEVILETVTPHDKVSSSAKNNSSKHLSSLSNMYGDDKMCGDTINSSTAMLPNDITPSKDMTSPKEMTSRTHVEPSKVVESSKSDSSISVESTRGNKGCLRSLSGALDLSLFKNWLFLLIIMYAPLGLCGAFIAFYFPSLGVDKGLPRSDAALLLTVVGGVDMVSRLVVGYVADLNIFKRTHLVAVNLVILGTVSQFTKFYSSFGLLAMYAVVYGLCAGTCQNLLAVVVIDLLGLEQMGKTMGLVLVVNATVAALVHPIIGALVDGSGSFVAPFNFIGACLIVSAMILSLEPLARRLEKRRMRKMEKQNATP